MKLTRFSSPPARSIISNPPILLLDEATSALDTHSERLVQRALDEAAKGRTSIVVAHRLSTIKDSHAIYVMSRGKIAEYGTHQELVAKGGVYAELVKAQEIRTAEEPESDDDEEEVLLEPLKDASDGTPRRLSVVPISSRRASTGFLSKNSTGEMAIPMEQVDRQQTEVSKAATAQPEPVDEKKGILGIAELLKNDEGGNVWGRVVKLNKPETKYLILGTIGAAASGAVMPLWGLIFSNMLTIFGKPPDELSSGASFWAGMFAILGVFQFFSFFLNIGFFTMSGERLTMRMRLMCYEAILRQDIAWFDHEKQSTGQLTAKLADDATQVKGLFGQLLGSLVQSLVTAIVGIGIALHYTWQLTLVILATIPIVSFAGYLQFKSQHRFGAEVKSSYEDSNNVPTEAISNVRTVAILTKEEHFYHEYEVDMEPSYTKAIKGVLVASLGQGFSAGARMFVNALSYYVGMLFMKSGTLDAGQVQGSIFTTMFSGCFCR